MNSQVGTLRIQGAVLVGMLILQYALGMYVNLFVSFSKNINAGQSWQFAWEQPILAAHIILAVFLLIGAIVLCVRAVVYRHKVWIRASIVGLLAILAAFASGTIFIPSQTAAYSYAMSLAFLVALAAYGWGLYISRNYLPANASHI